MLPQIASTQYVNANVAPPHTDDAFVQEPDNPNAFRRWIPLDAASAEIHEVIEWATENSIATWRYHADLEWDCACLKIEFASDADSALFKLKFG